MADPLILPGYFVLYFSNLTIPLAHAILTLWYDLLPLWHVQDEMGKPEWENPRGDYFS